MWGVFQAPPGMDIPEVVGGSKAKMPSMGGGGGVWIFSGTTQSVFKIRQY